VTRFLIEARDLARFMAGRPGILLVGGGADPSPFAGTGLEIWYGALLPDDRALIGRVAGSEPNGDEVEIPVAPTGIVAVLFAADQPETPWRAWFAANLAGHEPEFLAADPPTALRAITARMVAEQARIAGEGADLHLALARVRQDYERSVAVSTGLVRALAQQPSGELTLACASEPATASTRLDPNHPFLTQPLGIRVDRIAAVAIAVAQAIAGGEDGLRVRLSGIESGCIFGSWLVPAASLNSGWLQLDLPALAGWAPETAQLELHFSGGKGHFLDLAEDRAPAFPENLPVRPEGSAPDRTLAVKVWCADLGRSYVLAEHWDWSEVGSSAHLSGIPLAMPLAAYARMRVVGGGMPQAYNPNEPGPMVAGLFGGQKTLMVFPLVCTAGMDVIEAEFGVRGGDLRNLAVALWLQPVGRLIAGEADLLAPSRDVAWSGWHSFGGKGHARVVLELPAAAPPNLQLVVVLDASTRRGSGLSLIEINRVMFHALNPGGKARRRARLVGGKRSAGVVAPRTLAMPAEVLEPAEAPVSLREVILDEHFDNGESYRHLDLRLARFAAGGHYWPYLKFRVVVDRGAPALEFRDIPAWPRSLTNWSAASSDQHGKLLRLFGRDAELELLRDQAAPEDLALIRGLVQCLPGVLAKAALLADLDSEGCAMWSDTGEELAAKLARHAALG